MKNSELALSLLGLIGLGVGGAVIYSKTKTPVVAVPQTGGGSPVPTTPQPAAQNSAPPNIGIFQQAVDSAMNLVREPRGIRNNNPLNIEWNSVNNWVGQTGSDGRFAIFDKPEHGIRAAAKILKTYAGRGVLTIEQIIGTWAPATENNVENYVKFIEQKTGKNRREAIVKEFGDYVPMLAAMIHFENGKQPYPLSVIQAGVNLS